ncbi:MAG: hypothetical protein JWQ74_936 [Marmoricola sp.]|nr:hypothetical protein [Marmoricola sp.]
MATTIAVRADLRFSVTLPGRAPLEGTLVGRGNHLELRLADPVAFAGRGDARSVRAIADGLAGYGITVSVIAADRPLLELGATRAGWLQRRLTGSRHLRVVSLRGAVTGARGSTRGGDGVLPGRDLVPPTTLYPLAPTFARTPPVPVSTTHDPRHGGNPRLVLTVGNERLPESGKVIYPLGRAVTTIGSDETCDVQLRGLAPFQAEIIHDESDELVLVDLAGSRTTRVNGSPVERRLLRTGARIELGPWIFAYRRAEYADHGRPFGGRIGGELGHQKPQSGRHRANNEPTDNPQ